MFILARVGDGVYQLLLILHILAVIVAFAPAVVHPLVARRLQAEEEGALRRFAGATSINTRTVHLPALLVVGVLGMGLVGVSDKVFKFSDPWVAISIVLWLALGGVLSAMVLPGERGMAAGEPGAAEKTQLGGTIATLLLLVVLFLMVVKPG